MKKYNNKKGFTLVELLAVIVVLAIIMVIAVPNVLNSMNNAKKKSFQIEAERLFDAAMQHYESEKLMGEPNLRNFTHTVDGKSVTEKCYTFQDLNLSPSGFTGFVIINPSIIVTGGVNQTEYKIYLTDKTYAYVGAKYKDVFDNTNDVLKNTDDDVQAVLNAKCGE